MIALVTGAAGFVGSHLAGALLDRGYEVLALDNFCTGRLDNLTHLRERDGFHFEWCDVSEGLPPLERVDAIFHFASPASPKEYARLALETLAVNAHGTEHCCALAARTGARFVFASTSEIYGDPLVHPQPETYWGNVNPDGPRSCYDEGKRYGEAVAAAYRTRRGVDARVVRIFNTYGPRMRADDGRVVPAFFEQALSRRPLTVFGDGKQTRSLNYVDDTVETILRFAELPRPAHHTVNVGSEEEVEVVEIARLVAELAGVPLRTTHLPPMPDDPHRRRPDLSRARAMLGALPNTPLRDGLARTFARWRAHPQFERNDRKYAPAQ